MSIFKKGVLILLVLIGLQIQSICKVAAQEAPSPLWLTERLPHHPRLLLLKGEQRELLKTLKKDPLWLQIHQEVLGEADRMMELPLSERKMVGRRLLRTARENLHRIFTLSYAYRTTSEAKYAIRAEEEMLQTAAFNDWNPSHFLDVAEMTLAMAIGYDWLYDWLCEPSRATIRQAIIEKGLNPSLLSPDNWFIDSDNNWNQVCNTGMTFGALAVAEYAPQLAATVIARAIRTISLPMSSYAPNGNYLEGPSYWGYGTTFNVLFISALEKIYGDDFGLCDAPGFMQTADYVMHMISPYLSQFAYSDNALQAEFSVAPFWFYQKTGNPSLLYQQARILKADTARNYLKDRTLPAMIIWGAGAPMSNPIAPQSLNWEGKGMNPVVTMRSSWEDSNARFVGIKAGKPELNHGHMDVGSFVFEANGIRWATELGMERYNALETKGVDLWIMTQESQRWDIFRYNNLAHNTLSFNNKYQRVDPSIPFTMCEFSNPALRYVTLDMTPAYAGQVKQAERAVALIDNDFLLIEDRIEAGEFFTRMRWTLVTEATPTILSEHEVELTKDGQRCLLKVDSPTPIVWRIKPATSEYSYDSPNPGMMLVCFDTDLNLNVSQTIRTYLLPGENRAPVLPPLLPDNQ